MHVSTKWKGNKEYELSRWKNSETFPFLVFVCFISIMLKCITRKIFLTKAYSLAITSLAIIARD